MLLQLTLNAVKFSECKISASWTLSRFFFESNQWKGDNVNNSCPKTFLAKPMPEVTQDALSFTKVCTWWLILSLLWFKEWQKSISFSYKWMDEFNTFSLAIIKVLFWFLPVVNNSQTVRNRSLLGGRENGFDQPIPRSDLLGPGSYVWPG